MKYNNIVEGILIEKKNRFIAIVNINDQEEEVHIKNTGRLKDLMVKGRKCYLQYFDSSTRKTKYDLISIEDENHLLVNIDSQANNTVMKEWLHHQDYDLVRSEYKIKNSRFDFYMEKDQQKYYLEVKGCTMQKEGIGQFPDAPSSRAVKHVKELIELQKEGHHCIIAFVIGMAHISKVEPSFIDPDFQKVFEKAKQAGVEVWFMTTMITKDEFKIIQKNQ